ncbi:unnamed protein product [Penicillium salamii]|uniref:SET domain-containing protein n=1 Tax=Penicillium salamii TaxID=1612424 RepID=A0A9W4NKT9_9EURO|nr:unnamed protein product [Penicillium salamii]
MTDTSSLAITHATTDSYPVPASRGSPAATDGAVSDSGAPDEEPYTIKCICSFQEDDGSTVFCERCDTWQHISCYYPGSKVPEVHNCVDCEPRILDDRRAHERQRQRRVREKSEDGDRKSRRPGKTQKRKTKETDVNESNLKRHDSNARDQPPTKKTKGSHRASASVSGMPTAPAEQRTRRSSTSVAMSPTNSDPSIPLYSTEFLHLYDNDQNLVESDSNLLPTVHFIDTIMTWIRDGENLNRLTEGLPPAEFAQNCVAAFDSPWPKLTTHTFTDSTTKIGGIHPTFKVVKTQDPVRKNEIVGEIFGALGTVENYKSNPDNRWETLQHPEPFVFFSSQLPLYIDSRREGNQLRYIRRSCDANVMLKIYITHGQQYHFCFIAKQDIPADSEITTMWYLDPTLALAYTPPPKQGSEASDNMSEIEVAATCISNTLSNYGGCACERGQNCLLANLDRRSKPANGKQSKARNKSKAKAKAVASPMETGRASASRAGSETTKHPDEDDAATDTRSTSGSARDRGTHSRDVSPTTANPQSLPELSSRERRKIADAEKQFQQLEKGAVGTKRKKRVSGLQSTSATHSTSGGRAKADSEKFGLDGDVRSPTDTSPATTAPSRQAKSRKSTTRPPPETINRYLPSPFRRVGPYVDASTQLYPNQVEHDTIWDEHTKRGYRVGVLPLQFMNRARFISGCNYEQDFAQQRAWTSGDKSVIPAGVIPWWCPYFPYPLDDRSHYDLLPEDAEIMGIPVDHGPLELPLRWSYHQSKQPVKPVNYGKITLAGVSHIHPQAPSVQDDVVMREAPSTTEKESSGKTNDASKPGDSAPWPSTVAHSTPIPKADHRGDLHISMPPPGASNIQSALSPGSNSVGSSSSPVFHDTPSSLPFVATSTPAPVATPAKKKLSLGDYLMRRGTMANTPTSDRSQAPTQEGPADPVWVTGPQHFLAITTLPDDYGQSRAHAEADADKNEPFSSRDVPMEDAPEPAPTNTQSVSS